MPVLDWIGKPAVVKHHREVPYRLLEPVPELSHGDADSGNLIVQGDNLLALKALLPRYAGQVKCIYIDPPYNTGNEGWAYNDNVNSPEIRRWLGEVVGKEGETLDRHDRWLCMMYPRLVLLKQFLREDGVIFISIDDNEVHHLRTILEEVGGWKFVGCVVWERKRKGSHLSKKLTKKTEYVVICSRRSNDIELVGDDVGEDEDFPLVKRTNGIKELHVPVDRLGPTKLPDGIYPQGRYGRGGTAVDLLRDASVVDGKFTTDVYLRGPFVWTQQNMDRELASNAKGKDIEGLGGGFQFCKLSDEPLFTAEGLVREDVTFAQLAEFVWFVETGCGLPVRPSTGSGRTGAEAAGRVFDSPLLGVHEGRAVYLLYNGILKDKSVAGGNVLTAPVLDVLPPFDGPRVIYAAACRLGTARLAREGIVFKQTPYALEV